MVASELIEILMEVPSEIAEGLRTGRYVRRGGVIQEAAGAAKGEVKLWLKEVGATFRDGGLSSSQVAEKLDALKNSNALLSQQLSSLQMTSTALLAGQAVTLGVVAAGFVVMNQKLNALNAKMDRVLTALKELGEDVSWLDRRLDVGLEARVRGAIEQAAWASGTGRSEALVSVRATLGEAVSHYQGLLREMTHTQRSHRHADLYAGYHSLLALAGVAKAQCDARLDGTEAGARALDALSMTLGQLDEELRSPMKALDAHPHLLRLPKGHDLVLREALVTMRETSHRVAGQATVLAFCAEHGLPLDEWDQAGAVASDEAHLVFLRPRAASR